AALEAAAYGVRHHLETLEAAGLSLQRVTAVGGGARHDLWPQIVSDVTGLSQQIPRSTVGASYGGARLAAELAHGTDTSGWNPVDHRCVPDPAHRERYDELYRLYRELYPATREITPSLAALQRGRAPRPEPAGDAATVSQDRRPRCPPAPPPPRRVPR